MPARPNPLLAIVILAAAGTTFADNPYPADWFWGDSQQRAEQDALVGRPAPPLDKLSHWMNGELTGDDLAGKIVVVDFWATWCGPCLGSIPHNNEMASRYADRGVVVLGVCGSSRGQEKLAQVVEERKVAYPVARDQTLELAKAWNVMWWPTYGVIDRAGNLRALGLKPGHVENVVQDLLNEAPAEAGEPVASDIPEDWQERDAADRAELAALFAAPPLPPLQVADWLNTEPMTLDDLEGKVVLLDFWATWCGPCLKSIPHTNQMQATYRDAGLVVIGVCHPEGSQTMAQVAQEHSIEYAIARDAEGRTVASYLVNSYPDYYLIDRAGRLRIADCANGKVEEAVQRLLAEPYEPPSDQSSAQAEP